MDAQSLVINIIVARSQGATSVGPSLVGTLLMDSKAATFGKYVVIRGRRGTATSVKTLASLSRPQ
jgi:hypothetical protein